MTLGSRSLTANPGSLSHASSMPSPPIVRRSPTDRSAPQKNQRPPQFPQLKDQSGGSPALTRLLIDPTPRFTRANPNLKIP
jgi:hypothetical protein